MNGTTTSTHNVNSDGDDSDAQLARSINTPTNSTVISGTPEEVDKSRSHPIRSLPSVLVNGHRGGELAVNGVESKRSAPTRNKLSSELPRSAAEVEERYERYKGMVARVTAWAESGLDADDSP